MKLLRYISYLLILLIVATITILGLSFWGGKQKLAGKRGASLSVQVSKERGFYLRKYKILGSNDIAIGSAKLKIEDCFLEKGWVHGDNHGEYNENLPYKDRPYQLVLILSGSAIMNPDMSWALSGTETDGFHIYGNYVHSSYLSYGQCVDTLVYDLIVGAKYFQQHGLQGDTIQELVFVKQH